MSCPFRTDHTKPIWCFNGKAWQIVRDQSGRPARATNGAPCPYCNDIEGD